MKRLRHIIWAAILTGLTSCSFEEVDNKRNITTEDEPIQISGTINSSITTRATDEKFCDGDVIGIYIVDYNGNTPGTLQNAGNRADNVRFTFDETTYKWIPAYDIYWKDDKTHIDVFGYYPWGIPEDVKEYAFDVKADQRSETSYGKMNGYEASDFLWGSSLDNAPTANTIILGFHHKMALVRVSLLEGTGFNEGEWAAAQKQVVIMNTAIKSSIDLSTGIVTASDEIPTTGIIPNHIGSDYRAIIVPQTVNSGKSLMSITIDGESYFFKKTENMVYNPSKQHNFTMTINKKPAGGGLEFVLTSESITVWETEPIIHDVTAREYVVINVPKAGTLDECIRAAGKDLTKVKNLKVTGQINTRDFAVMKYKMSLLTALNLKEVIIVAGEDGYLGNEMTYYANEDDEIPNYALNDKTSLVTLILPEKLKKISGGTGGGRGAFNGCVNLAGSLTIPEGVEEIGSGAFGDCYGLTGTLTLPSTLKVLGTAGEGTGYHDGAFANCSFVCELKLPDGLEVLGRGTFYNCNKLFGEIRLPEELKELGSAAFYGCKNLTGSILIPQNVTIIHSETFSNTNLGGTLTLHDGITSIGTSAFMNAGLRGELRLPKHLEVINSLAFASCDFSGILVLPENLYTIGNEAFFGNWRLMGTLTIPENVVSIGYGAFAHCRNLEGVIFPEGLENILSDAFVGCHGIGRIVCEGAFPAYVEGNAFDGVAKDNFTLEVPESSIHLYQTAEGWKDFKRIAAYRNLTIRPSLATAINTSATRDLVLTADDEWYVESQPDWVTLNKTSGKGKTEIKLTFAEMPRGSEPRVGEVIFMLKDKNYRTRCRVTQYDYEYSEDEFLTLHESSQGNGKLNIVLLGDGFNAQDISEGKLMESLNEAYYHFFDIEPYKSYKDYFNVYAAISVSPESGVGGVNTIIYNKFNTTFKAGVSLGGRNGESDFNYIIDYIGQSSEISYDELNSTAVILVPNTYDYGGICYMWDGGFSIAYCPLSDYGYPLDFRGVIQHEAGGHGFGKLGDEYIYHNEFIDFCTCTCCPHVLEFNDAKRLGWYENLSLTGKMSEVPWGHLIFHEKYNGIVDVFEGGYMHNRGVYRSEHNSCMNNNIPYYSTISRESIVKRIKAFAGEEYSFEEFVAKDVIEVDMIETRSGTSYYPYNNLHIHQNVPVFMGKLPIAK